MFWFTARFGAPAQPADAPPRGARAARAAPRAGRRRQRHQPQGAEPPARAPRHACRPAPTAPRLRCAALRGRRASGGRSSVAVLDYMMPGCDGFELGRRIRADPRFSATRLVLLTSARGSARRRGLRAARLCGLPAQARFAPRAARLPVPRDVDRRAPSGTHAAQPIVTGERLRDAARAAAHPAGRGQRGQPEGRARHARERSATRSTSSPTVPRRSRAGRPAATT